MDATMLAREFAAATLDRERTRTLLQAWARALVRTSEATVIGQARGNSVAMIWQAHLRAHRTYAGLAARLYA